ncbi:ATP-binding protein [Sinimarinibacterium sp. HSW-8]|uniref:histidine kinase n=2 Tax=Sinimarinibacterium thermocellulolyticum TaxID=3170016 RepID=A0ABV2A8C9_9GAMM
MAISVGAALVVLAVLVVRTQSEPQTVQGHLARMITLAQLRVANEDADIQVARARLRLTAETDGLRDAVQRLEAARASLSTHRDEFRAVSRDLSGNAAALIEQIDTKTALIGTYERQLRQFASVYERLRAQVETLLAHPALPLGHALHGVVRGLIEEITAYALQSTPDNRSTIESLLDRLGADAASVPALRGALLDLGRSTTAALGEKDRVRATAQQLADIPIAAGLDDLQQRYVNHYVKSEFEVARYRNVLVIYASALLVVFGFVGWRLRRSYAELQDMNAKLEATVEARTAELRKALNDVRMQQAQLVQSEKMAALGQMVAGVAHEINTPLGYARGNVETVREALPLIRELFDAQQSGDAQRQEQARRNWPPEEGLPEIEMLLADADYGLGQIGELVRSLKDFARVDRSLNEMFDLNEGMETTLKICHNQLKGRIEVKRDYGDLPPVPCAPSQINQVFLNLLNNAAQAIDGPGVIAIRTRVEDGMAVVEVRDSGCGMDAETRAHIFEPFFTTKPVGQGTGLGLSIVFRIVEDHRGSIDVESAVGQGTTFRLRLPLQRPRKLATADADSLQESVA